MNESAPLRIVFAGTPDFAAESLKALLGSHHQVIAVYTQPDRPAGRGRKLTPSPVKQLALEHSIPVYQPLSLKDEAAQQQLAQLHADLMVVVAYGLLLPQAVLDTPRLGCINVHASLLPRWRGAAPIQRAIEAGDTETGITIMQMDAGLDTGAMLYKRRCPIEADDTAQSLHDKLATLGGAALLEALEPLAAGTVHAEPQDDAQACYAAKLHKGEGALDWTRPAHELERQVRAFNPWPVAYTELNGERLRIWRAETASCPHDAPPGTVLAATRDGILIACGTDALRLTQLQLPGGKALEAQALLNARGNLFKPHQTRLGA